MMGLPLLALLAAALTACGSSSSSTGGRPPLPSGVEVRHPAAPIGGTVYLNLLTESGESVFQQAVTAGATSTAVNVNPASWQGPVSLAQPVESLLPAGAEGVQVSAPGTRVLFLRWLMWQDRNSSGTRDPGEALDLMTHDRVVYAAGAVNVSFTTAEPKMLQRWQLGQGWGRAEHFVYLPLGSDTYRRSLESQGLQRYELHVPTPITSQ
nr:hypothetical protein [Deinococcus aestuarii]